MHDPTSHTAGRAATKRYQFVGTGFIDGVPAAVWAYEVSGKQVLRQWFSYRKKHRERPIIGDRRPPSKLGEVQPDRWLADYTTELLNLLHVLGRIVEMEPAQAELLGHICAAPTLAAAALRAAGALATPAEWKKSLGVAVSLFGGADDE